MATIGTALFLVALFVAYIYLMNNAGPQIIGYPFLALALLTSPASAVNTTVFLNAQRAADGLPALRNDPQLQQAAEWAARQRSLRGMNGHLHRNMQGRRTSTVAGRWEGTARRNSRRRGPAGELWGPEDVYACYQNHRQARYVGCASVLGPDGYWYYQINLK